jgi:transposase
VVGEGERRRRYVVCHNPQEEKRQRAHRQQILRELEAELASLHEVHGEAHTKQVCQLRASRRYGRYLRLTRGGLLRIDAAKQRAEARLDGKFVIHSNDDSLTPTDLALGYKQLQRVEEAWRTLKSGLRLRPVFHWAVHRIHAHVALSVLALLLERVIEQACGDTWRNIRADLEQIKLAQLSSPHGEIWQVTEPSSDAAKRLKCLEIKNPPAVIHLT